MSISPNLDDRFYRLNVAHIIVISISCILLQQLPLGAVSGRGAQVQPVPPVCIPLMMWFHAQLNQVH